MKNHQKGFITTIVLVVVAILAVGGGVYVYENNKVEAPFPESTEIEKIEDNSAIAKSSVNFSVSGNTLSVVNNGTIVQTVSLSDDAISSLSLLPALMDTFITNQDVNFDGHNDVAVFTADGYGGVNTFYDYYIFNPQTGKVEKSSVLVNISNPKIDISNKKIISSFRSGPQWYSETFQWNGSAYVKSSSTNDSKQTIDFVREYDSEEKNVISNTERKVTLVGKNFLSCDKPMNCEQVIYIGDKSFNILIPSFSTTIDFIPTGLKEGMYDLYLYNPATDKKSNVISVKVVDLYKQSSSGKCGLSVTSVSANAKVSFPLTITGNIDSTLVQQSGCGWGIFEGVGGKAELYHNYKNQGWKKINEALIIAPYPYPGSTKSSISTTLDFNNSGIGLPSGTPLKVVFSDDDARGLPLDIFELPLTLK